MKERGSSGCRSPPIVHGGADDGETMATTSHGGAAVDCWVSVAVNGRFPSMTSLAGGVSSPEGTKIASLPCKVDAAIVVESNREIDGAMCFEERVTASVYGDAAYSEMVVQAEVCSQQALREENSNGMSVDDVSLFAYVADESIEVG